MSDKTKYYRDLELIRRQAAALQARKKPEPIILCQCGHGIHDRQLYGSQDRHGRTTYYCADCLPAELKAIL